MLFSATIVAARVFTVDDFDPADPGNTLMSEAYQQGVADLVKELTVTATGDDGTALFTIVPFPMELVALRTQARIQVEGITDPDELSELVAEANAYKPAPNSFMFILEGDGAWVSRDVTVYYVPDETTSIGMPLTVYPISIGEPGDDGTMLSEWAIVIKDENELKAFRDAPRVVIIVGDADETIEPLTLDCGFWRQWGLFDLRTENAETPPLASE